MILKFERFSHLSGRSLGLDSPIRLEAQSIAFRKPVTRNQTQDLTTSFPSEISFPNGLKKSKALIFIKRLKTKSILSEIGFSAKSFFWLPDLVKLFGNLRYISIINFTHYIYDF